MADPLDDKEFMAVKGVAPFEVALVFEEWSRLARGEREAVDMMRDHPGPSAICDGRGPPWPLIAESHRDFGRRMARGLYLYLKEV